MSRSKEIGYVHNGPGSPVQTPHCAHAYATQNEIKTLIKSLCKLNL